MRDDKKLALEDILMNIIDEAEDYQMEGQYELAAETYEEARVLADLLRKDSRLLHSTITECYRNAGQPEKAIQYYRSLIAEYEPAFMFDHALLTSVAAAFCDDDQWEMAEQTLHKAKDANKGEFNYEMYLIEDRIKQYYYENKPNLYR